MNMYIVTLGCANGIDAEQIRKYAVMDTLTYGAELKAMDWAKAQGWDFVRNIGETFVNRDGIVRIQDLTAPHVAV